MRHDSQSQKQAAQAKARAASASLFSPAPYSIAKPCAINRLANDAQTRIRTVVRGALINAKGSHSGAAKIA
jgi:hypothetical protein